MATGSSAVRTNGTNEAASVLDAVQDVEVKGKSAISPVAVRGKIEDPKEFEKFGLGRGVNMTESSPFANKKPYQVCPIDSEDTIIRTDEGNALHTILQRLDASNTSTIQLSASVTLPHTPVQIRAAADYSRCTTRTGYTVGRMVITRSIEFRKGHRPNKEIETRNDFEQWIRERLPKPFEENKLIKFIVELGITHYVSKIQLGAAEYCTMSEEHYGRHFKDKMDLGVDKIAGLALSASKTQTNTSTISETKRIGLMRRHENKDTEAKGAYQQEAEQMDVEVEAVVDVQIESIANLINDTVGHDDLRGNLSKALCTYIAVRTSYIPASVALQDNVKSAMEEIRKLEPYECKHEKTRKYAIYCSDGEEKLFLGINKKHEVEARKLKENEQVFSYFKLRFTETPDEFIIMYSEDEKTETIFEKSVNKTCTIEPSPRYLHVTTHLGHNSRPLRMENTVDESHCRLMLRPRLFREHSHVTMSDFTNGKDMFYICTSRRRGRRRYLRVKDKGERTDPRYILACKSSIKGGNSDDLMLFRLVRDDDLICESAVS